MTATEIIARLAAIRAARAPIGYDLEGVTFISCQAFAESPSRAFVVVTDRLNTDSAAVWQAITAVLEDPLVPKWTWNAAHELTVLRYAHGIALRGFEDGMALWFERWPELPRGLKYAASILTRQPCWTEGISFDEDGDLATGRGEAFYLYNAHDAAATLEIALHKQLQMTGVARERYEMRLRLTAALSWASLKGIRYDAEAASAIRAQLEPALYAAQARVNGLAGVTLPANENELLAVAAKRWCKSVQVRKFILPGDAQESSPSETEGASGVVTPAIASPGSKPVILPDKDTGSGNSTSATNRVDNASETLSDTGAPVKRKSKPKAPPQPLTWDSAISIAKKDGADALSRIQSLWTAYQNALDTTDLEGELAEHLGLAVNVKSNAQVTALLNRLGLPKVFRRGERGNDDAQTKDADALLNLYLRTGHPVTTALLETIALRTRLQELNRQIDRDGRIRCLFNSCGTETDRTVSHKFLTGSGGNLQTVPRSPVNFRRCYTPDEGHEWWKADYTGADAWTVAARCATLGDDTMLRDLQAGLRIPTLLGLALEGVAINKLDRAELAKLCASFVRDWRDIAFKRSFYGWCYGMTPRGVRRVTVADSYAETGTPRDPGLQLCARIQLALNERYWGVQLWHRWVASELKRTGTLTSASGLTREFFGRRIVGGLVDESTLKEAYAFEPQANTTYCLNRAVDALWTDPENRDAAGEPIIQTLLVVHDEGSGQSPLARRDWVRAKVRAAFERPLQIGKVVVTIPVALRFGRSWGECKEP